jgi:hypothetical protein
MGVGGGGATRSLLNLSWVLSDKSAEKTHDKFWYSVCFGGLTTGRAEAFTTPLASDKVSCLTETQVSWYAATILFYDEPFLTKS